MKFSLKITICILVIVSILFGISSSLLIGLSFQRSLDREKEIAYDAYIYALESIQKANETNNNIVYSQLSLTAKQLYEQNKYVWSSISLSIGEKILYQSEANLHIQHEIPQKNECIFYINEYDNKRYLTLSGSFSLYNEIIYFETVHNISTLYDIRDYQLNIFIWIFVFMIFMCSVVSYNLSKRLTAPLEKLSRTTKEIVKGDFSSRVLVVSNDEVGKVSQDFNIMADHLEKVIEKFKDTLIRQEEFMGSFAHELKTPMTSIIGYSDLIRSGSLNKEEQLEAIQYIFTEGKRLEGLSQKLLRLLEIDKTDLNFKFVYLNKLIESVVYQIKNIYTLSGINLNCCCEEVYISIEPDLIKSLLINLIDNAKKAIDKDGNIYITLERLEEGCRLCIYDDGRGIPEESIAHLIDAFYRVDKARSRKQGGVGLGLSLCKKIVDIHHGKISFKSYVNEGTCVIVDIVGGYHEK